MPATDFTITRYRALLIGVRDYHAVHLPAVKYAVQDVEAVADLLRQAGYEQVELLHSDQPDKQRPSITNINNALARLTAGADDHTLLLFYFAGHGDTYQEQAYLLPPEELRPDQYDRLALGVTELQRQLQPPTSRAAVLILDACHTGANIGARDAAGDVILKTIEQARGLTLLSATDQHSRAFEDDNLQHGVFTHYFLEALRGQVHQRKSTAYLTVSDAYEHVNLQLELWSAQNPSRTQRPTWQAGVYGDPPLLKLSTSAVPIHPVNPFIAGPAIRDPRHFYGRQVELQAITGRVGAVSAQSISIVGERRMGKSSLLWQVKNQAESLFQTGHRYVVLYLDLSSAPGSSNVAMMRTLRRELSRANLPTWTETADGDLAALSDSFSELESTYPNVRPVLCLDEFEYVTTHPQEFDGLVEALRYEGQLGRLALVTASHISLADLCAQGGLTSPFFNIFTQVSLGPLDEIAWRQLVKDGLGQVGPEDWRFIQTCAHGHPFFTQLATAILWEARQRSEVDYDALQIKFEAQTAPNRNYKTRYSEA